MRLAASVSSRGESRSSAVDTKLPAPIAAHGHLLGAGASDCAAAGETTSNEATAREAAGAHPALKAARR